MVMKKHNIFFAFIFASVVPFSCLFSAKYYVVPYSYTDYKNDTWALLKQFGTKGFKIGALTASSPWLVQTIIDNALVGVNWYEAGSLGNVLEAGAGSGPVTRALVRLPYKRLDVVEMDPGLFKDLSAQFKESENFKLHNADISKFKPPLRADDGSDAGIYNIIISTLPFSCMPDGIVGTILEQYARWLVPNGRIVYISFCWAKAMYDLGVCFTKKSAEQGAQEMKRDDLIARYFDMAEPVRVLRNFPPAYVHVLTKKQAQEKEIY